MLSYSIISNQNKFCFVIFIFVLLTSSCVSGDLRQDCRIVAPNGSSVKIQLAKTEQERSRGLMYKKSISDDQGMLFIFNDMQERTFWMKNTFIPLDMIFIDDQGVVRNILDNVPPLTTAPRNSEIPVKYVLEVAGGSSKKLAIEVGSKLDLTRCGEI